MSFENYPVTEPLQQQPPPPEKNWRNLLIETLMTAEHPHLGQRSALGLGRLERAAGHPHRQSEFARRGTHAAYMITVLMGNDDGGQGRPLAAGARQAPRQLDEREATVQHNAGSTAFDQRGIAAATAAEGSESHAGCGLQRRSPRLI